MRKIRESRAKISEKKRPSVVVGLIWTTFLIFSWNLAGSLTPFFFSLKWGDRFETALRFNEAV